MSLGLLAVAALSVSLLVGELTLSAYHKLTGGTGYMTKMRAEGSPFLVTAQPGVVMREGDVEYRINSLGMRRDGDVATTPPAGTIRILSYGDSVANGWAVKQDEMYTHRLEESLREDGGAYEVLNMFRGFSPTITSFHVREDVPRLDPDGVILEIELLNDTSDEAHVLTSGRDEHGLPQSIKSARYILGWDGQLRTPVTVAGSLLERTSLWTLASRRYGELRGILDGRRLEPGKRTPLFTDESGNEHFFYNLGFDRYALSRREIAHGFDRMFASIDGIHRFLDDRGVRFLLVIMPSQDSLSDGRYRVSALAHIRAAEERAEELGIPHVSLHEALQAAGGERLYRDFCHPTAEGHRVIAESLETALSEW